MEAFQKVSLTGAPIKSWIQSLTTTFDEDHPNLFKDIGTHFIEDSQSNLLRAELIVQDATKPISLTWKAFGHRPIDGWLYGKFVLKKGNTYIPFYGTPIHVTDSNYGKGLRSTWEE